MADLKIIGDRILSMADLEAMNQAEIKSRKYKYCTIECDDSVEFLAKAEYTESSGTWGPGEVYYNGEWISRDAFQDTEEGQCFSVKDYRLI